MKPFGFLFSSALTTLAVGTVIVGITSTPVEAWACTPAEEPPLFFPQEGQVVPTDVVMQTFAIAMSQQRAEERVASWTLQDADGTDVPFEVVVDDNLLHLRPTQLLTPGDHTLSAPGFFLDVDERHFTVVDEEAPQLPPPNLEPSRRFVEHGEGNTCTGPGTHQSFVEDSTYSLLVWSFGDVVELQSAQELGDLLWGPWRPSRLFHVSPGTTLGARFGGFDAAGRFSGWGPVFSITAEPRQEEAVGCLATTSSPWELLLVGLFVGLRRKKA